MILIATDFAIYLQTPLKQATADRPDFVQELIGAGVLGGIVLFGVWMAMVLLDRRPMRSLGLQFNSRWSTDAVAGVAIGVGIQAALVAASFWFTGGHWIWSGFENPHGLPAIGAGLLMVGGNAVIAFHEELLSRGYQLTNVFEGLNGPIRRPAAGGFAVLLTAMLFGALHLGNANATWLAAGNIVAAGVLLGLAYYWSGSLGLPIGVHFGWNFAEGSLFGLPVSGGPAPYTLWRCELTGPKLLTGGRFGPEGGIGSLFAVLLGILLVGVWTRVRRSPGLQVRAAGQAQSTAEPGR